MKLFCKNVCVCVSRSSELVVLQLSSEGRFKRSPAVVSLPASPWCCEFDWSDRLWVCLPHEQDPVQCWLFEEGKVCEFYTKYFVIEESLAFL